MPDFREGGTDRAKESWQKLFGDLSQLQFELPDIRFSLPDPDAIRKVGNDARLRLIAQGDWQSISDCADLHNQLADAVQRTIQHIEIAREDPSPDNLKNIKTSMNLANEFGTKIARRFPPRIIDKTL